MGKKTANNNPPQSKNRRRRNRNRGGSKDELLRDLAIMGVVADSTLSANDLKMARDMAQLTIPGRPAMGPIRGYIETTTTMLICSGIHKDDAVEIIQMMAGTGQCLHWSEIPDFDPNGENRDEQKDMKGLGTRFFKAYKAAADIRKAVAKEESKDDKKIAAWKGQW
jgi:hypothetical protein